MMDSVVTFGDLLKLGSFLLELATLSHTSTTIIKTVIITIRKNNRPLLPNL